MKRIVICAFLFLVPFFVWGQGAVVRTDRDDKASVAIIKIDEEKKQRTLYDAKLGFQQQVEAGILYDIKGGYSMPPLTAAYIGGWRFNNYLFLGVGLSLNMNLETTANGFSSYVGEDYIPCNTEFLSNIDYNGYQHKVHRVNVPVFLHLKTYFMRTRVAPFASFSVGGKLARNDCSPYVDISFGANYRINDNHDLYLSVGCSYMPYSFFQSYSVYDYCTNCDYYSCDFDGVPHYHGGYSWDYGCGDEACPYYEPSKSHAHVSWGEDDHYAMNLSIRIGITL